MSTKTSWLDICNMALRRLNNTPIALTDFQAGSVIGAGSSVTAPTKSQVLACEMHLPACIDEVSRKFRWNELVKWALLSLKTTSVSVTWTAGTYGIYNYYFVLPADFDINGTYSISPSVSIAVQLVGSLYRIWCVTNPGGETFTYTPINYTQKAYCYALPSDYCDALDSYPNNDDHTFIETLNVKNYITSESYILGSGVIYTDDPHPILMYLRLPNPLQAGGDTLRENMWYLYALRLTSMIAGFLIATGSSGLQEAVAEYNAKVVEAGRNDQKRGKRDPERIIWGEHSRRGFRRS